MRYLFGFMFLLAGLVALPLNVSAQAAEEDSLNSWQAAPDPSREEPSPKGPASFVAPKDKALVVFVRPKFYGKADKLYVLDENKKLLTFLKGKEHVTIEVEPGKYTFYFYVRFGNACLVRAELVAGRTYVVHTHYQGFAKPRVVAHPVLRSSADFAESAKWIRDTKRGKPDLSTANRSVKKRQDAISAGITAAEAGWLKMDEMARSSLTLRPEDGRTPDEASEL
jgi:hypothetical protein